MKHGARVLFAVTLLLLTSTPSSTEGPNLIVNGSFETGDFSPVNGGSWVNVSAGETKITGWTVGGDLVNWHNSEQFVPIQDGGFAVDLENGGFCYGANKGSLSQTIATTVGVAYELTFYLTGPTNFADGCSGTPDRTVQVDIGGASSLFTIAASHHLNLQWTKEVVAFVATSSATTISFSSPLANGYWGPVIDNVSVIDLGPVDSDGDTVPDGADACANTPPGAIADASGCSVAQLCPCVGPVTGGAWRNHGQYVSCVSRTSSDFIEAGLIASTEHGEIVSEAARSSCGKK